MPNPIPLSGRPSSVSLTSFTAEAAVDPPGQCIDDIESGEIDPDGGEQGGEPTDRAREVGARYGVLLPAVPFEVDEHVPRCAVRAIDARR